MSKALVIALSLIFLSGSLFIYTNYFLSRGPLVSPLVKSNQVAVNLWFPKAQAYSGEDAPLIGAKAAYFIETNTGQVLYQKNSNQRLPVASLIKIMTALVAVENKKLDDQVVVSLQAASMEPDHMLLIPGEKLTLEELLYGVFLVSANDAAEAIAETTYGNRAEFITRMNQKAAQIGMKDTMFINPTGLEENNQPHYSTAFDVALMGRYAAKHFPFLVNISSTPHIFFPQTSTHQDYDLYSGINLLTTYPGVVGLKTGYTPEAGLTLVTLARHSGHEVLGVVLGSNDRRAEAKMLLDYSFKKLGVEVDEY